MIGQSVLKKYYGVVHTLLGCFFGDSIPFFFYLDQDDLIINSCPRVSMVIVLLNSSLATEEVPSEGLTDKLQG